jgi:hypothetical protein
MNTVYCTVQYSTERPPELYTVHCTLYRTHILYTLVCWGGGRTIKCQPTTNRPTVLHVPRQSKCTVGTSTVYVAVRLSKKCGAGCFIISTNPSHVIHVLCVDYFLVVSA